MTVIIRGKKYEVISRVEDNHQNGRTHLLCIAKPKGRKCWCAGFDAFSGKAWIIMALPGAR